MKENIKKSVIIYNPVSTGFKEKDLNLIARTLKENNIEPELVKSMYQGHLIKLVKEADAKNTLILTLGGDGTVGEAYQAISKIKQKGIYAHVPTGTTNDMAKNYNVTAKSVSKITEDIINGEVSFLDSYSVNGKIAAYTSVFGYLAHVPYVTNPNLKKYLGHAGYVLSAAKDIIKKPISYDISYQTEKESGRCNCMLGAVSNSKGFAGINLYKDAKLDDGKIELLLLKDLDAKTILSIVRDYLKNDIDLKRYQEHVIFKQAKNITLTFNDRFLTYPIDIDGENSEVLPTYQDRDITFKVEKPIKVMRKKAQGVCK